MPTALENHIADMIDSLFITFASARYTDCLMVMYGDFMSDSILSEWIVPGTLVEQLTRSPEHVTKLLNYHITNIAT